MDLNSIKTEQRNSRTAQIDTMSTLSMVKLINEEDKRSPWRWEMRLNTLPRRWM